MVIHQGELRSILESEVGRQRGNWREGIVGGYDGWHWKEVLAM